MKLPDWCFGRRFWIGCQGYHATGGVGYGFAEETYPEQFMLWAVMLSSYSPAMTSAMRVMIRLSTKVFTGMAEVQAAQRLLKGVGRPGPYFDLYVQSNGVTFFGDIRQYCSFPGHRLAIATNGDAANLYYCDVNVLISSVPKEIPDWLLSDLDKLLW